ncbi:hypothetical protein DFH06DRAFT_516044 [Mycena polygramma]|nr:hypothetical protein DFH06DRAFT_516044 [Mycena polygramma]
MGRALFSETYGFKAPAIRVAAPEPVCPEPGKWSISNPFDPDSDEFFDGAEYEAFMDHGEVDRMEHPVVVSDSSSSSSSDGSDSGRGSPVIDGVPRPIRMNAIWDRLVDESAAYQSVVDEMSGEVEYMRTDESNDVVTIRATADPQRPRAVAVTVVSSIHPPSSLRNSTTATDLERAARRASVPPISIPLEPSTPGPASPTSASESASPTTPSPTMPSPGPGPVYTHLQLMTPSPAPPVTPRVYVWGTQRAPVPASPSPSAHHPHSAGPLTNPSARQSLARITPRRRAQNV